MKAKDELPQLLTAKEVAYFLNVSLSTVRRWCKEDLLNPYRIGLRGSLRFKREDILKFLESRK